MIFLQKQEPGTFMTKTFCYYSYAMQLSLQNCHIKKTAECTAAFYEKTEIVYEYEILTLSAFPPG